VRELTRTLARQQDNGAVAATLNRLGERTGRGNAWTEARVRSLRRHARCCGRLALPPRRRRGLIDINVQGWPCGYAAGR